MAWSLGSLLSRISAPVETSVAFLQAVGTPEQQAAMEEYAAYCTELRLGSTRMKQSSEVTCGATSLLVARCGADQDLAMRLVENPADISEAEESLHTAATRRSLGPLAWPKRYGIPPWALAREMNGIFRGVNYWHTPVDDSSERGWSILQWVYHAAEVGLPSLLLAGDNVSRGVAKAVPRHTVLVMPGGGLTPDGIPQLIVFDPASGCTHQVPLPILMDRTKKMPALGRWTHVVWAVLPYPAETERRKNAR